MNKSLRDFLKKVPGLRFAVRVYCKARFYCGIVFYNSILLPKMMRKIKRKEKVSVAFEAYNVSMWKYDSLYRAMEKDERFEPFVILTPSPGKADFVRQNDLCEMQRVFAERKYNVYPDVQWDFLSYKKKIPADIIFICQPYGINKVTKTISRYVFCQCPYAFENSKNAKWNKDTFLQNIALSIFVPTSFSISDSQNIAFNRSRNRIVTGHVYSDSLIAKMRNPVSPWKDTEKKLKRIIYAPHFSIDPNHLLQYSTFITLGQVMRELAEEFNGKVQWALKPHPFLFNQLCKTDGWGQERAQEYYDWWANQDYTQLEIGAYEDLFATSDGIIHDCGSFIAEYLFTGNPCFYLNQNNSDKNTFGKMALSCYYRGSTKEDIRNFIQNVVLDGNDTMKEQRENFYNEYLIPPNGKTAAENIIDSLSENIWGQNDRK